MNRLVSRVILAVLCGWISSAAFALDNQWFVGVGGGGSWLVPNPVDSTIDDDENLASYGTVLLGRDLGRLSSVQVQLHSLGTAVLTNQQEVSYNAAEMSLLYRFFDSRDTGFNPDAFGVSFYGRFGLGGIFRDEPDGLPLKNDTAIYFSGGAGFELYLTRNLALRLEAAYVEEDAAYGGLSLVGRFGGTPQQRSQTRPVERPSPLQDPETPDAAPQNPVSQAPPADTSELPDTPTTTQPTTPAIDPIAQTPESGRSDRDRDGVDDVSDECPDSAAGYPVRSNGCPVLKGVLSGVKFAEGSATLLPDSFGQLDSLISLLTEYPSAKIQIIAHTDNQGSVAQQSQTTRGRLRTIGTYLVRGGIRANRLILRSLGGSRPAYDNNSAEGRAANNRVELLEHR